MASVPELDVTQCPDDIANEVTCSYLAVPEDRSDPARTIEVMVGRITPPEVLHDDPMLVVGRDLASSPNYGGIAPLAERVGREVIIMDTRGVGHSRPDLDCTELASLRETALTTATDDPATRVACLEAVSECHDRLAALRINLASYNVSEMAADVEDLHVSLGAEEWNLITYGTASRVALEEVRNGGDHVRSLLMDSPEVPGVDPRLTSLDGTREATRPFSRRAPRTPDASGRSRRSDPPRTTPSRRWRQSRSSCRKRVRARPTTSTATGSPARRTVVSAVELELAGSGHGCCRARSDAGTW